MAFSVQTHIHIIHTWLGLRATQFSVGNLYFVLTFFLIVMESGGAAKAPGAGGAIPMPCGSLGGGGGPDASRGGGGGGGAHGVGTTVAPGSGGGGGGGAPPVAPPKPAPGLPVPVAVIEKHYNFP